jgi:mannose-6-phosphate isomerase-like protein (cupin superfamily)
MPQLKSTLKVFNQADLKSKPGPYPGHTVKMLVGNDEHPTERLRVILPTFDAGLDVPLHWHAVEGLYFIISGRAVLTDIENKSYEIGPGSVIYITPGIASAHEWHVKERMQLIGVRATTSPEKNIQYTVDKSTMRSFVEFDYLIRQGGDAFKSIY